MQKDDIEVVITQLLGRVSSADPFVLCDGTPQGNSSRWVFDVYQNVRRSKVFSFQLKSWAQNREVSASVLSFSITPMSASFWQAGPFVLKPHLPNIQMAVSVEPPMVEPLFYRVAIDLVHSTSR